jgi:DNA-directed RNA polymerase specialized sigma24 family protein
MDRPESAPRCDTIPILAPGLRRLLCDLFGSENLPRHERRFPYRALTPTEQHSINREAGKILAQVDPALRKMIRKRLPGRADADDIAQQVRIAIWNKTLARFDAYRGVKVTTFVIRCIRDLISNEVRKGGKQKVAMEALPWSAEAPDESLDHEIEQLAELIRAQPERFFQRSKPEVLKRLLAGESPAVIARCLAIAPGPLYDLAYKVRMRISEIAPAKVA